MDQVDKLLAQALGMLDRLEERLHWMETESKFAHACPDLDQEYPDPDHAEAERVREYTARMYTAAIVRSWAERFAADKAKAAPTMTWYLDQLGDA